MFEMTRRDRDSISGLFSLLKDLGDSPMADPFPISVYREEGTITARMEVPGVCDNDVLVTLEDKHVSISFTKKQWRRSNKFSYGNWTRTFSVPASVTEDHIKATLKDGILTLKVTVPEPENVKAISISSE